MRSFILAGILASLCAVAPGHAQFAQQGAKLTPPFNMSTGNIFAGQSVAISSDGNTAIAGGPADSSGIGAAWVYVRDGGGNWTQQAKLTASNQIGSSSTATGFGYAVGISADGNTAVVGNPSDNSDIGAAWIFTRSGSMWSQGAKLIATDSVLAGSTPTIRQGNAVAISGDGLTVAVGGPGDNDSIGALWIYVNDGSGNWSQQGTKLIGSGSSGKPLQGASAALSYDGTTALVGGTADGGTTGATWVFTRSGTTWSQQGAKLVGTGISGSQAYQGWSVALSADGDTALTGGALDGNGIGAVWVFTRSGGIWSQQGGKLASPSPNFATNQGGSVAIAADGNTLISGGNGDEGLKGSAFVFTRHNGAWTQQGDKLVPNDRWNGNTQFGMAVALSSDGNTAFIGGPDDLGNIGSSWAFVQTPIVTAVGPSSGVLAGGATVTITGSGFTGATAVKFDGTDAASFTVVDPHTITATTPAHALGTVDVVVTNSMGSGTGAGAYSYLNAPTISSVLPSAVPTTGGATVTITGTDFLNATAVTFDFVAATSITVVDNTHITAVTRAMSPGSVPVDVTTPAGRTPNSGIITFVDPPAITAINPNQGTVDGGTLVSIVGTNLNGATGVRFGATASSSFSVSSSTTATATAPPHAAGLVHVTLTTPGGTTAAGPGDRFTYTPKPVLAKIAAFNGGAQDGARPFGALIADKAGALYGTTSMGGTHNKGTVFRLTPPARGKTAWTKTILHSFVGSDGAKPYAGLAADPKGVMYGTTTLGGAHDKGVVFRITTTGAFTMLHSFTGGANDGGIPFAGLVSDTKGNIYGVTTVGGAHNKGALFKMAAPSFQLTVQHSFAGTDGATPRGTPILDTVNNLYGTTIAGGASNIGVVFKRTAAGAFSVVRSMASPVEGKAPYGGVAIVGHTLFALMALGGNQGKGSAFMFPPSAEEKLFDFAGTSGISPYASPVLDANKAIYGTTFSGGATNHGTVFRILPPANRQGYWTESVLYSFKGGTADGANPYASVLLGKDHVLYGTASAGGGGPCAGGCGMVFMLTY